MSQQGFGWNELVLAGPAIAISSVALFLLWRARQAAARGAQKQHHVLLSFLLGLAAMAWTLFFLLPAGCADTMPPQCTAALGYRVPSSSSLTMLIAATVGFLVAWLTQRVMSSETQSR
jgi:hypothetical protein